MTVVVLVLAAVTRADTVLPVQADAYMLYSYYAGWSTPDGGVTWDASYTEGEILGNNYGDSTRTTMNVLDSTAPGANGDTYAAWSGYANHPVSTWYEDHMNGPYARRAIIQFNLTGITAMGNAILALRTQSVAIMDVDIYRGTQAFVETEVSWNAYAAGSAWATPGGDYDGSKHASFTIPTTADWVQVEVTDLVRDALTAGQPTATFLLLADNADIVGTIYTRDYTPGGGALGDYGATLTIGDPVPEPGTLMLLGAGGTLIMSLLRRRRLR